MKYSRPATLGAKVSLAGGMMHCDGLTDFDAQDVNA